MAWLSVIIQLLSIPVGIVGVMLEQASADAASVNVDADFSINGLLLALVLFILARVFRTGAQMREDLEGTV
jgi:ABC-type microcin C transport system permease subunit YejB